MSTRQARRVFLLGIDGLPPSLFDQFVREGRLPRFSALLSQAARATMVPTLPALTCPSWLSIASGSDPQSMGISNLLLPQSGAAPDCVVNGFDRARMKGEFLWDAMSRQGLPAIVLKYPGSWPPRPGNFIQVDGAGGYADITCEFEHSRSAVYLTNTVLAETETDSAVHFPEGYRKHWRTHTGPKEGVFEVTPREPRAWAHLPADLEPAWEFVIPVEQLGRQARLAVHGLAGYQNGSTVVVLSRSKDATGAIRLTPESPWSDWWFADTAVRAPVRFKLLLCDVPSRSLRLYRTAAHRTAGYTQPPSVAEELLRHVGPMSEWTGTYDLMNGLVDFDTQLEIYRQHTEWMAQAIRRLATCHPWSGFFMHWHVVEYAHHLVGASLSRDHPLHPHETAGRDVEWLGRVYALADELLGAVQSVIDPTTLLVVASDHGHDLVHSAFFINHFLRRHGWLVTARRDGREQIDWTRSVAYGLFPGFIRLNLASRWEGGILAASDAQPVLQAIAAALRGLQDPRTGRHPVKVILDRDEMAAFGQGGELAPDLIFCLERGYETATRLHAGTHASTDFELCDPYREVTSGHGSFFPASLSARTLTLFSGGGVGPAHLRRPVISATDIAPTLAQFLGIDPPVPCCGHSALYSTNLQVPA